MTPRQATVMRLLAHGYTNAAIAAELGISEATVRNAIAAVYAEYGIRNRVEGLRFMCSYDPSIVKELVA